LHIFLRIEKSKSGYNGRKKTNRTYAFIIWFVRSQLSKRLFVITNLELQTEIDDSNKGAETFVIAIIGKSDLEGRWGR